MSGKIPDEIRAKLGAGLATLELKTPGELLDQITLLRNQREWLRKALFDIATDRTGSSEHMSNTAMSALAALGEWK